MRTYDSYEDAVNDRDLDLRVIWECDECGAKREDSPGYNEGGPCPCGGTWQQAGESYNG